MRRKAMPSMSISALFFLPSVDLRGEVEAFGGKILARWFLLPPAQTFVRSLILGTLHSFYPRIHLKRDWNSHLQSFVVCLVQFALRSSAPNPGLLCDVCIMAAE